MSIDERVMKILEDGELMDNPRAVVAVLKAVVQERERCAKIAADHFCFGCGDWDGCRQNIASDIREGK